MATLELEAKVRDLSVKPKDYRKNKQIPAVCYGQGMEPEPVAIDYQTFRRTFREAGTSQVISLMIEGKKTPVLVHDITYNSLNNEFHHIDFLRVNMKEEVVATVPVEVEGVSPAVKNLGGILSIVKDEVEVKALPSDIPPKIVIDIEKLENIGDAVHISDLQLGDKVEILAELEEVLVSVSAAREYEEESVEVPDEMKAEEGEAKEGEDKKDEKSGGEAKKE